MSRSVRTISIAILVFVLLASIGKVSLLLLQALWWESHGLMHGDAGTYTYVGRALLNGLTPYVDIFDAKPPGIYVLFAISLFFTGGEMIVTWIQVLCFALFPLLCTLFAFWVSDRDWNSPRTLLPVGITLIGSALLMLYAEERGGALQPEGIGFFFSLVYALLILRTGLRTRWTIAAAGLALLASIGMKETFLFTNVAIALLASRSWKELPRTLLLPLAFAVVLGILGLLLLGLFHPYLGVHLPNMLTYRVTSDEFDPLWLRMFNSRKIYADMAEYNPWGYLTGWLITVLWISLPIYLQRIRANGLATLGTVFTVISVMMILSYVYGITYVTTNHPELRVHLEPKDYAWLCLLVIGVMALCFSQPRLLLGCIAAVGIATVAVLAIAAGVTYHPNFFVLGVPVTATVLLLWARWSASDDGTPLPMLGMAVLAIAATWTYVPNPNHLRNLPTLQRDNYAASKESAAHLDALLDACQIDRYVSVAAGTGFWFAKHSPWGPLPGLNVARYFPADHYYGKETADNIRNNTQIIIHDEGEKKRLFDMVPEVPELFTTESPECAKPHLPFNEYTVLFRKQPPTPQQSPSPSPGVP